MLSHTRRVTRSVAIAFTLGACVPPRATQAQLPGTLRAYLEDARRTWQVPGMAIAVVNRDSLIAAEGFGVRQLGTTAAVDAHTLFDVASLTKSFTAAAVGILVDEGKMRWDDPVRRYLPAVHFPNAELDRDVTIRDLLAHRVGLDPSNWIFRFLGEEGKPAAMKRVAFLDVQAPFRTTQVYWNTGYLLVGEATAAAAGMPWEDFVRRRLLEPLGMTDTRINGDLPAQGNIARPHAVIAGVHQVVRSGSGEQGGPASGIRSTATDMATWLRFQLSGGQLGGKRLVSEASMEQTHSPQVIIPTTAAMRRARSVQFFAAYGMGWQIMDYRGHPMIWHTGNADGAISYMAVFPDDGIGIVVLINSWIAPTLHGTLASSIADHYLGLSARDWSGEALRARDTQRGVPSPSMQMPAGVAPSRALSTYTGSYQHGLYGPIRVFLEGERLVLQIAEGKVGDLTPLGGDSLHLHWRDPLLADLFSTTVRFEIDSTGRSVSLSMPLARNVVRASRN